MAKKKTNQSPRKTAQRPTRGKKKSITNWKPGSEADQAKMVGTKGDFGVPENPKQRGERDYVSKNTKVSDRGAAQPFAWEHMGVRDHGAGARSAGHGSSSGGDLDTDIIGVGTGGSGISASGPGRPPGHDDSNGSSNEFASPLPRARKGDAKIEPAQGRGQKKL